MFDITNDACCPNQPASSHSEVQYQMTMNDPSRSNQTMPPLGVLQYKAGKHEHYLDTCRRKPTDTPRQEMSKNKNTQTAKIHWNTHTRCVPVQPTVPIRSTPYSALYNIFVPGVTYGMLSADMSKDRMRTRSNHPNTYLHTSLPDTESGKKRSRKPQTKRNQNK